MHDPETHEPTMSHRCYLVSVWLPNGQIGYYARCEACGGRRIGETQQSKTEADAIAEEHRNSGDGLPVWGCFRTVGVNRVRHQPHDWVQGDQAQTRYYCDGAE